MRNFFLLILTAFSGWAMGLNPPEIKCLNVQLNGAVVVHWQPVSDPLGHFIRYELYASANQFGPYTSFDINNISTTDFTVPSTVSNAHQTSWYFFLRTVFNDGSGNQTSNGSDTLRSIYPDFSAQTDSTVTLTWNKMIAPNLPTSNGNYTIYRKIGSGSWVFRGQTLYGNETFNDSFKICFDTISYRIETADLACLSVSAVQSDEFRDMTPPNVPLLDTVSVEGGENVRISWQPSSSPDTDGYTIFHYDSLAVPPNYNPLGSVFGRLSTTYLDILTKPLQAYQQFTIVAFDSCHVSTPPSSNSSASPPDQRTIFLEAFPDICAESIVLSWTSYIGWTDLTGYDIYFSVDSSSYSYLASVSASDSSFRHENIRNDSEYCYFIKARRSDGASSTSIITCIQPAQGVAPNFHYITQIKVGSSGNTVEVSFLTDSVPAIEYVLERALPGSQNYLEVASIPFTGDSLLTISDPEVDATQSSYDYRVGITDTCFTRAFTSEPANSIFLDGDLESQSLAVTVSWTPYIGWTDIGSFVDKYEVYRIIDGLLNPLPVAVVPADSNSITDNITDVSTNGANICYQVVAIEGPFNVFGRQDESTSNIKCFTSNAQVYVPNAFAPNGLNSVFRPVITFGDFSNFQMTIYDRWGTIIHKTNSIEEGWDGTSNGRPAKVGSYIYLIEVSNFSGDLVQKKGVVTLYR
jgi:gliding motility-associated-like protein